MQSSQSENENNENNRGLKSSTSHEEVVVANDNNEYINMNAGLESEDGYETEPEEDDHGEEETNEGDSNPVPEVNNVEAEVINLEENVMNLAENLMMEYQHQNNVAVQSEEDEKQCWVCFGCEQDDPSAAWTHPCRCSGTTKWVHQACIQRWVDEKQKGNTTLSVECPQCGTAYVIRFPRPTFVVSILDSGDMLIQKLCPIITGGVCVGSIYWTMVTFGAVTFMQTVGHDRSLVIMERADPMLLLVSLPLVPVGLIIGQMIRWEETLLKFLRVAVPKTPVVRSLMPAFAFRPNRQGLQSTLPPMTDPISLTRIFCGALFFPTIATFLGATLYKQVPSQLKRTLLGGLTFALVKGVFKIYHKQHSYVRQCQKQILDFAE